MSLPGSVPKRGDKISSERTPAVVYAWCLQRGGALRLANTKLIRLAGCVALESY